MIILKNLDYCKRQELIYREKRAVSFLKEDKVGPIELATISFGQRFEITPIQMITAVSTIANKGTYVKPRLVKQIIDSQTGEVTEVETEKREGVISIENC